MNEAEAVGHVLVATCCMAIGFIFPILYVPMIFVIVAWAIKN